MGETAHTAINQLSPSEVKSCSLLLCTNGKETTFPALAYGLWLARLLNASVDLLGIVELPGQETLVQAALDETVRKLEAAQIAYQTIVDKGRGSEVIARVAQTKDYLTVIGPLGRPTWQRLLQGRSFRRILERVESPILYVPTARLPLKHMLICLGGLKYAQSLERMGLHLARLAGAKITLLHVVEPINLDYPTARQVQIHWKEILSTETPQGQNLRQALEEVRQAGLEAEFKVRHGSVVHEILDEVNHGPYDLLGMGSAYSAHSLRHLYMPNVTAEIAEVVTIPLLSVRLGHALGGG
jgi:nucleotide-binding universal stress UspA family protein